MNATFTAPDIECEGCASAIKNALGRMSGVSAVEVDVDAQRVSVRYEEPATMESVVHALDRAGFPPKPV
jgi:copper chaperone CopZ